MDSTNNWVALEKPEDANGRVITFDSNEHVIESAEGALSGLSKPGAPVRFNKILSVKAWRGSDGSVVRLHLCADCGYVAELAGQISSHRSKKHRKGITAKGLDEPVVVESEPEAGAPVVRRPYANAVARALTVGELLDSERRVDQVQAKLAAMTEQRDNWKQRAETAEGRLDRVKTGMLALGFKMPEE